VIGLGTFLPPELSVHVREVRLRERRDALRLRAVPVPSRPLSSRSWAGPVQRGSDPHSIQDADVSVLRLDVESSPRSRFRSSERIVSTSRFLLVCGDRLEELEGDPQGSRPRRDSSPSSGRSSGSPLPSGSGPRRSPLPGPPRPFRLLLKLLPDRPDLVGLDRSVKRRSSSRWRRPRLANRRPPRMNPYGTENDRRSGRPWPLVRSRRSSEEPGSVEAPDDAAGRHEGVAEEEEVRRE